MNTPVTAIDQRYSDAKAVAITWDNVGAGEWPSEVFSVTPVKVFAHAKGDPSGATTHRF